MREPHPTELLSAYFDRELSRVERARIEERVFGARPAPRPRRTFGWVRQVSLAAAALVVVGVVAGYFALRGGPGTGEGIGAPAPTASKVACSARGSAPATWTS